MKLSAVFLVRADDDLAKLRLLLVEQRVGIGKRLVAEISRLRPRCGLWRRRAVDQ